MIDVGALELHHPDGQVFSFEPGSLALAFAVTGPGTYDGPLALFQTLRRPADLERWAAEVVGAAGLRATADDLELAVRLQAAIWNVADARIDRRPVPEDDRAVLNELAAQPCLVPRLLAGPTRTWVAVQGVRSVMSSVACGPAAPTTSAAQRSRSDGRLSVWKRARGPSYVPGPVTAKASARLPGSNVKTCPSGWCSSSASTSIM